MFRYHILSDEELLKTLQNDYSCILKDNTIFEKYAASQSLCQLVLMFGDRKEENIRRVILDIIHRYHCWRVKNNLEGIFDIQCTLFDLRTRDRERFLGYRVYNFLYVAAIILLTLFVSHIINSGIFM
jgi:hypothetical protein